ncbi:MAG: hypothetical protein HY694_18770 [Deltaproteobacteria bacterium]|nr:hypothetical protein [Deltaproteobacteria bacterium]
MAAERMPYEIRRSSSSPFPLPLRGGEEQGEGVRCMGRRLILDDKGFSLLASILAMMGLAFMGVVFASAVTQHQYSAVNQMLSTQAFYIAEAGFELAIQELLDNQNYAFNGVGPDTDIGTITSVPIGAGRVSIAKGTQTPPVLTATATVGDVTRVVAMTLDVKNLITQDWTFPTNANLPVNWTEFDKQQNNIGKAGIAGDGQIAGESVANGPRFSSDGTSSFRIMLDGQNATYFAYRQQNVNVPANKRVVVRHDFKKNYTFTTGQPQSQELALLLWRSGDNTFQTLWSDAAKVNNNLWQSVDLRGILTGSPAFDRVRFRHDVAHNASAQSGEKTWAWLDNISVNVVEKSAWNEP